MPRKLISSGSEFEQKIGYSRAVVDGDWMWMSGTTGFDYAKKTISDNVVAQTEQAFVNIKAALDQAGFAFADVVRCVYILPNAADFESCWPTMGKYLGTVRPAITMMEAALSDPKMKIEIELTLKKRT